MRWAVTVIVVGILAGRARADARIAHLVKGYEREYKSCEIQESGIAKMLDGATMLLERGPQDGLAADVKTLHAAHEVVASYCTALAATIEALRADPSATYKSLEKQIRDHDNHIRMLRQSSKKAIEDTEPLIPRWIPRINAARVENDESAVSKPAPLAPKLEPPPGPKADTQPGPKPDTTIIPARAAGSQPLPSRPEPKPDVPPTAAPTPDTKPISARFPSGRRVKLPRLAGTWQVRGDATTDVAEYVEDGTPTSVVVEAARGVSCASQLARLQAKAYGRQAADEQPSPGEAWRVLLAYGDVRAIVACASTRTGSNLVTLDAPDASHPDLSELARTMLAALAK